MVLEPREGTILESYIDCKLKIHAPKSCYRLLNCRGIMYEQTAQATVVKQLMDIRHCVTNLPFMSLSEIDCLLTCT